MARLKGTQTPRHIVTQLLVLENARHEGAWGGGGVLILFSDGGDDSGGIVEPRKLNSAGREIGKIGEGSRQDLAGGSPRVYHY